MAEIEKTYKHPPAILWNLVNDIVEMRKGKIKSYDAESMTVTTDMYGIKLEYLFRVVSSLTGETSVTVESAGETEDDRRRVELMFATLENMLGSFEKPPDSA